MAALSLTLLITGIIIIGLVIHILYLNAEITHWRTRSDLNHSDMLRMMAERNTALNKLSRTVKQVSLDCTCPDEHPTSQGHRMDCPIIRFDLHR